MRDLMGELRELEETTKTLLYLRQRGARLLTVVTAEEGRDGRGWGAGGWRPQVWVEVLCVVDGTRRGEQVKGSGGGENTDWTQTTWRSPVV